MCSVYSGNKMLTGMLREPVFYRRCWAELKLKKKSPQCRQPTEQAQNYTHTQSVITAVSKRQINSPLLSRTVRVRFTITLSHPGRKATYSMQNVKSKPYHKIEERREKFARYLPSCHLAPPQHNTIFVKWTNRTFRRSGRNGNFKHGWPGKVCSFGYLIHANIGSNLNSSRVIRMLFGSLLISCRNSEHSF